MIVGGRRGGKSLAQRTMVLAAVADGQVVHVAGPGGLWRVTPTGIGPLWEKIGQPCPDRVPRQGGAQGRTVDEFEDERLRGGMSWAEWTDDPGQDCHSPALPSPVVRTWEMSCDRCGAPLGVVAFYGAGFTWCWGCASAAAQEGWPGGASLCSRPPSRRRKRAGRGSPARAVTRGRLVRAG